MKACFIGHRTVINAEQVEMKLYNTVMMLIGKGVDTFLFGSKSKFDSICHGVVSHIRKQFPNVVRICYCTPHETAFTSKEDKQECELFFSEKLGHEILFSDYEKSIVPENTRKANKNAYIMRNMEMINNSDFCVFYYDKDYLPPPKKSKNNFLPSSRPKSGTAIAYRYAKARKKEIINFFSHNI